MLNIQKLTHQIFINNFYNNKVIYKYIHTNTPTLHCKIDVNNRLKVAGGQEFKDYRDNTFHIQISGVILNHYPSRIIIGVLKHELTHYLIDYYNLTNSKGNRVRPHGKEFKAILKSVKGLYTIINTFKDYRPDQYYYIFRCIRCGNKLIYKDKNANKKYICNCHGSLKLKDKIPARIYLDKFIKCEAKHPTNNVIRINNIILN